MNRLYIFAMGVALSTFTGALQAEVKPVTGTASISISSFPLLFNQPVTGQYDTTANKITIDPWYFFGSTTNSQIDLLSPGSYFHPGVGTLEVGAGQLGGFITTMWSVNNIPHGIVWDVVNHPGGQHLAPVDSDGDGVPGHAMISGPFPGFTFVYELDIGEPSPTINVELDVTGGSKQECNSTGGNTVQLNANIELLNGAELASISWTVDGALAGTEASISPFLSLGTHNITVTATGISGISDTASTSVSISDTHKPDLSIDFVDTRTGLSVASIDGNGVSFIEIQLNSTDICDDNLNTSGVAKPVYAIMGSEIIKIQGNNQTVDMPTTAIEVTAISTDRSNNKQIDTAVLPISN